MQIAHISDLHYANETLTEVDHCTGAAVDFAISGGVDLAVISGDATDHGIDVHSPAFLALAKQIRRLTDHCPVLMLQGTFSHEPPGTLDVFRLLGGRYPVFVADRIGQAAWCGEAGWITSNSWAFDQVPDGAQALFTCLPTVNKADIASAVGARAASETVGEQMAVLLSGYAPINRQARALGVPTIGVSHGTVNGCLTEHGVPMAGLDHEFTVGTLFSAETSAFMLGHIHRHQCWEQDGRHVAYAGSIGRLHYGEEGEKGALLWEVSAYSATARQVVTPSRKMVDVVFDGKPDLDVLRSQVGALEGCFVRVRWQVAEEDKSAVDRKAIEAILEHAAGFKLEGRVIPVLRARAEGISQTATLAEKIERWATLVDVDPGPLAARLVMLESRDPVAVANQALAILSANKLAASASAPQKQEMADLFG